MTDRFADFIGRILGHEGGYVHHPSDPGCETHWGISKRFYPDLDIRNLTRDQAVCLYRRDYWAKLRAQDLPPVVGFTVLDCAVNHGRGQAARWLQRAIGVADDGIIGPVTLAAARSADPNDTVLRMNAERLRFYARLSTFNDFGRGWTRRVADNLDFAAEDNPE